MAGPCASKNNRDLLINCIGLLLCLPRSDDLSQNRKWLNLNPGTD